MSAAEPDGSALSPYEAALDKALTERETLVDRQQELDRLIETLLPMVPQARRAAYEARINPPKPKTRHGTEVYDNVIRLIKSDKSKEVVTARSIYEQLVSEGVPVQQKQVHNALNYLNASGQVQRIGWGKYVIRGGPGFDTGDDDPWGYGMT